MIFILIYSGTMLIYYISMLTIEFNHIYIILLGIIMDWEWNSRLETGIKQIDEQHKELFNRIDQLELALYRGNSVTELLKLLEYLESYVVEHFQTEEKLLLDNFYPDFAIHSHQHESFRAYINGVLNDFKNKGADSYMAINIDKQMRKWWETHILKMDMAYVPYIKK